MFKRSEKYDIKGDILKCDYMRYSASELSMINTAISQSYINIPRGDAVNTLLNSLLDRNFDVFHAANPDNRYTDGDDIRLVNLGPIALFSIYKLTSSNGKPIEEINTAHIWCLMYKFITSSKDTVDLSIGFDRNRDRRKKELTNNKNIKGKYHVRIMLKDIFGFAEHQQKDTHGLGYKLALTRNNDSAVLNKGDATNDAKIKINSIEWLVSQYIPGVKEQIIIMDQIVKKIPMDVHYVERSVFMQEVKTQKVWQFHLGTEEAVSITFYLKIGFQQPDGENSQNLNNDTFIRLPVTSAQCPIGSEKYPDSVILSNYDDDDYSLGYGQIKEAFRALTKDDILKPYISEHDFRSSKDGDNIGYNLYVFDIRYQKNFGSAQSIKVEFKFGGTIPENINGYALVLTNKLISISSDGQRQFDLIQVMFNFFITSLFPFIVNSVFFNNASLQRSGKLSM